MATLEIEEGSKVCKRCGESKPFSSFYKNLALKDGIFNVCKICVETRKKHNFKNNPDIKRKQLEFTKQWKFKNKEHIKTYKRKYYYIRSEKVKENDRKRSLRWIKKKYRTDFEFKLDSNISRSICFSLKGSKNGRHWEDLVGYTLIDLENRFISMFTDGMTWGLFLKGAIVMDHILPRELFEYETPEDPQFKACWALTNIRPLWKNENRKKWDYLPDGRRASLLTKEEKLEYLKTLGYNF